MDSKYIYLFSDIFINRLGEATDISLCPNSGKTAQRQTETKRVRRQKRKNAQEGKFVQVGVSCQSKTKGIEKTFEDPEKIFFPVLVMLKR